LESKILEEVAEVLRRAATVGVPQWRTLVWDHEPETMLLTEAGGSVIYLHGTDYDSATTQTGLPLAHNPAIAQVLVGMIQAKD
jgi:hypothetical protein